MPRRDPVDLVADERRRAADGGPPEPPVVPVDGVPIHAIDTGGTIRHIIESLEVGRGGVLVTHNLDHLRRLHRDPSFAAICDAADLRVADGMPLLWAASLRGTPLPERVAGSSLVAPLAAAAAAAGRSIFLLGGEPGTADAAADVLVAASPKLRIAGTHCPPFGFERDPAQLGAMKTALAASRADIVLVALGSPKQEQVIAQYRELLPRAWWAGVGISFSFLSGDVHRAPGWMQGAGLEWVHRLAQEPRRLARRYLVDGIPFAGAVMARAVKERLIPGRAGGAEAPVRVDPVDLNRSEVEA